MNVVIRFRRLTAAENAAMFSNVPENSAPNAEQRGVDDDEQKQNCWNCNMGNRILSIGVLVVYSSESYIKRHLLDTGF